jgi:hypothetical protein
MGALVTPVFLYLLLKLSHISIRDFAFLIGPSVLASVGVVASVAFFQQVGPVASKPLVQLIQEVSIGGITGVAILLGADPQLRTITRRLFGSLAKQLRMG